MQRYLLVESILQKTMGRETNNQLGNNVYLQESKPSTAKQERRGQGKAEGVLKEILPWSCMGKKVGTQ